MRCAFQRDARTRYTVHQIDRLRLGLSFTDIASRLKAVAESYPGASVLMDATGLGASVYDS